jgi:diguanylate cyclase (GGDEF)-like protein
MMEMMALAERYHHKLSVCLISIRGLEGLSEEDADDALITTSALLTEMVRIPDKVGRYDDERFMVIMPEADYAGASLVAGRLHLSLKKAISNNLTISMGVAEFERGDDLQRLLTRAEQALAKDL